MAWATELAWAAGFFDGEGHVRACRSKGWTGLRLYISQAGDNGPPDTLVRFAEAVGGSAIAPKERTSSGRPMWVLRIQNVGRVAHVMGLLWPWLSLEKRRQYDEAWEQYEADWSPRRTKLTDRQRAAAAVASGSASDVARRYGVSPSYIYQLRRERRAG